MRLIQSLNDIPMVRTFIEENHLKIVGLRKAIGEKIVNGYPMEVAIVVFKEGADASVVVRKGNIELSGVDRELMEKELSEVQLPMNTPFTGHKINCRGEAIDGLRFEASEWREPMNHRGALWTAIFNENEEIVCVEERKEVANGAKICMRWSYFDDGRWRQLEPDTLPIWGIEQFAGGEGSTLAFLHEGPKAARAGRKMLSKENLTFPETEARDNHPWGEELDRGVHLGWLGGVNALDRVNWRHLRRLGVTKIILIPDNDGGGLAAAPIIAKKLKGVAVESIAKYPKDFPEGWDLADPIPNGAPKLTALLREFTWINGMFNDGKKDVYFPIAGQPSNWFYIEDINRYVDIHKPTNFVSGADVWQLMVGRYDDGFKPQILKGILETGNIVESVGFFPNGEKVVEEKGVRYLNSWQNPNVTSEPMTDEFNAFWEKYWEFIPDPIERAVVKRMIATQIVYPERRHCGLIVCGMMQGTGKTMLFEHILEPLIGMRNTSRPNSSQFVGRFNSFLLNSAVVYADELKIPMADDGSSAYNKIKEIVTGQHIAIEMKGMDPIVIPNNAWTYVTTNSTNPLYMETSDRRWVIAKTVDVPMSTSWAKKFITFLREGGIRQVLDWAQRYCEVEGPLPKEVVCGGWTEEPTYLEEGAKAIMTFSKLDNLEESTPVRMKKANEFLSDITLDGGVGYGTLEQYVVRWANSENGPSDVSERAGMMNAGQLREHLAKSGWWQCRTNKKRPTEKTPRPGSFIDADGDGTKRVWSAPILSQLAVDILVEKGVIEVVDFSAKIYALKGGVKFPDLATLIKDDKSLIWLEGTAMVGG